jgi:hypothetical protein
MSRNGDISLQTVNGHVNVDNNVTALNGDIRLKTVKGDVRVNNKVAANNGSVTATTEAGDIHIGDNGKNERTVYAKKDILLATGQGTIDIHGKTESSEGNITLSAKSKEYKPGADGMNILISDSGIVKAAGYVNLKTENGDIHITDLILSGEGLTAEIKKQGSVYFDRSVAVNGNVDISADQGSINVGKSVASVNGDISLQTVNGDVLVKNKVTAHNGDISLKTVNGNIRAGDLTAGNLVYADSAHGDIILDLANAKAVVIRMPDNTTASRIGTVQAEAGGPGVTIQGKYIYAGNILSKGDSGPLTVDLQAPDGKETITDVVIDNLSSGSGTVIPKLWADRGFIRVSNGYLAFGDIYTTDKIHAENPETSFALYGRTPTGDGEPHMYWNNVDLPHRTTPLLLAGSHVYTRMVDLLDDSTYTWLFERDYLKYVLEPEKPLTRHTGRLIYDGAHIVNGQRNNAVSRDITLAHHSVRL